MRTTAPPMLPIITPTFELRDPPAKPQEKDTEVMLHIYKYFTGNLPTYHTIIMNLHT